MEYYRPEIEADEDDLDFVDKMILQQEVKDYVLRKKKYEDNMNKAYGLILGQCTQGVKNKLEARQNWRELEEEHNPINLFIESHQRNYPRLPGQQVSHCINLQVIGNLVQY